VEYGVHYIGLDAYTPDEVARWFELVKATVFATNGAERSVHADVRRARHSSVRGRDCIYVFVALLRLVPDRRIERLVHE